MKITIDVTAEDIAAGDCDCESCPIALAINRAVPHALAEVGSDFINIYPNGVLVQCETPMEASQFISDFDRQLIPVQPFSFELETP